MRARFRPALQIESSSDVHGVVGERGKLLGLLVEARFEAVVKIEPLGIAARGIVREDGFKPLGRRARLSKQLRTECTVGAEHALFHTEGAHLLQNARCLRLVGPQDDRIGPRILNDLQCAGEVCITGHIFLLDHDRMTEPTRGVAKLEDAKAPVPVVDAQQGHALET